jgi:bilin biosynthesis protein
VDKRFFNLFNLTEDQAIELLETPIAMLKDPSEKYIAVSHLINFNTEKTVNALIKAIETTDVTDVDERIVRRKAVESLGRLEARAGLPAIVECLKDDDMYTVENAVWAIGEIGTDDPAVMEAIASVLDRENQIFRVIIQTLANLDYAPALERIKRFTTNVDESIRSAAIASVCRFTGDYSTIGAVVDFLHHPNVNARRACLQDLIDAKYYAAIPEIIKCPVSVVFRLRAIRMLAESGVKSGAIDFKRDVQPYLDITIADHPKTLQMVHSYQKTPTIDELMSLLYETDFGVCYLATQTLLDELPNEAPEALLATYQAEANNDYGAHYHVIKVLGWLKYAPAYELIVKEGLFNLEPQFQKSRAAAAIALGEIGDGRAIPELKKVLETRTWDLKYAALMALEKLGDRSGHEIAARDADWVVAARAKEAP